MNNIHVSKLTAALGCFGLGVALLWIRASIDQSIITAQARILASDHGSYQAEFLKTTNIETAAGFALVGAIILFALGLVLCIAAAFKRKAKPDSKAQ